MEKNTAKEIRRISNLNSFTVLMFFVLTNVLVIALASVLDYLSSTGVDLPKGLDMLLAMVIQYPIVVPITLLVVYAIRNNRKSSSKLSLKACFCKPQMPVSWVVKWIVIAIGMVYIANFVSVALFSIIQGIAGTEFNSIDIDFGDSICGVITTAVALPIFAPLFEEMMFRGTILRNCEPVGQWFAVVASAVLFGLFHVNYPQILYAIVLGIFAGFMVAKTHSIIPAMITHFIINTLGAVQQLLLSGIDINEITEDNIEYLTEHIGSFMGIGLIGMLIMCIIPLAVGLFIYEIVKHRDSFRLNKGIFEISSAKKTAIYYTAPVTIITYVLLIAMAVYNAIPK